jgi:hypothetical protein
MIIASIMSFEDPYFSTHLDLIFYHNSKCVENNGFEQCMFNATIIAI